MKKAIIVSSVAVLVICFSVLLYYSPLNYVRITDITADNIDDLKRVTFRPTDFSMEGPIETKPFQSEIARLLEALEGSTSIAEHHKSYGKQYRIFHQDDDLNQGRDWKYQKVACSRELNLRVIGFYWEKHTASPFQIYLRPCPTAYRDWEYFPKYNGFNEHEDFYENFVGQVFNYFKTKGYTYMESDLRAGPDILINGSIYPDFFLVVKKLQFDSGGLFGIEFTSYYKKRVHIGIFEDIFE